MKPRPDRLVVQKLEFLNREELAILLDVNPRALRRWFLQFPDFPKPTWISNRVCRWRRRDINRWFDNRPKSDLSPEWLEGRRNA
jgi:predicted DNA-binding transcriptional regulator AlpA